jgi:NAD(P)H-flavin reductase
VDLEGLHRPARLVARADAGGGMTLVTVDPAPELVASYVSPGQYIHARIGGSTGYFVLAGAPGGSPWELVMRAGGGVSDVLLSAEIGIALEVTPALGDGFPWEAVHGRPLVIALSGTGVAAGRPLVRRRIGDGDATRTQLFVGVRSRAELPLASDVEAWKRAGVSATICLSNPDEPVEGDGYARGYVQDVLRARGSSSVSPEAHVFAVGLLTMVDALRTLAPSLGIPPERVWTNH